VLAHIGAFHEPLIGDSARAVRKPTMQYFKTKYFNYYQRVNPFTCDLSPSFRSPSKANGEILGASENNNNITIIKN
jgi:hypothetical protein